MHLTAGKCRTQSSKLKRRRGALSKFCKLANQSQGVKSELPVQLFLPAIVVMVKEGPCWDVFFVVSNATLKAFKISNKIETETWLRIFCAELW